MAASASPARMASASAAMPPPKRWTCASTTMPSPTGTSPAGALPSTVDPVASSTAALTATLMRGCSAAGPTMSPSTAPASIEVSWPGSPTRISRASGRTASTSRAISDSDTIDVSSTITTSCGSRLPRSWRKRLWLPGRQPSSRWSVEASSASRRARIAGSTSRRAASPWTASSSRAAALPVGAASATSGGRRPRRAPARRAARRSGRPSSSCRCPGRRRRPRAGGAPRGGGLLLPGVGRLAPEQPREPVGEHVHAHAAVERRRRAREVGGDLLLLAPVAVEVERAAVEPQRAAGPDQRARRDTAATHADGDRATGAS